MFFNYCTCTVRSWEKKMHLSSQHVMIWLVAGVLKAIFSLPQWICPNPIYLWITRACVNEWNMCNSSSLPSLCLFGSCHIFSILNVWSSTLYMIIFTVFCIAVLFHYSRFWQLTIYCMILQYMQYTEYYIQYHTQC